MWDWISDAFTSVTDYIAPMIVPAAITYGGARLLGADNQTALLTAGLVGAGSKAFGMGDFFGKANTPADGFASQVIQPFQYVITKGMTAI